MALEDKEKILADLAAISDIRERFAYLIDLGKSEEELSDEQRTEDNRIKGCNSQLWLVPSLRDGKIYFAVDSDAAIPKGIAAILARVYSGMTPEGVLSLEPDFLKEAGIEQHLSMNRRNGLSNICKQINYYAIAYQALTAN